MTARAAAGIGVAGAAGLLVLAPLVLALALIGAITAANTGSTADGPGGVDPARIPPLARDLLPRITALTAGQCPELPPAWVVAQVAAVNRSGWRRGS